MLKQLWRTAPALMVVTVLMLVVLAGALVGLAVDSRTIVGAPAWLKPAKFAASIAVYAVTLAWFFTFIPEWTRTRRVAGGLTVAVMLIEMFIITLQAWRGRASHFNVDTGTDIALFGIMGAAILVQTQASIAVAIALWRQRFNDVSLGWALRLGMVLTIVGAMSGGLMTRPTEAQLQTMRAGERPPAVGAHTVGALDGGPGLPGVGWSSEHGDLRVAHLVGLHAMQALPLLALLLIRAGIRPGTRKRLILIAGASYNALFGILLVQALRGVPLAAPDTATLVQVTVWVMATLAAVGLATRDAVGRTQQVVGA
jgi:hypothetical protein